MPTTISAILVIVVFLMPGFIASRVFSFVYPGSATGESRTVLTAITFSCFNHAILSWLLVLAWKEMWYENLAFLAIFSVFDLFVLPVIIALLFVKMNETGWGRRVRDRFGLLHPIPKAWDYFFSRRIPCWIVATLKDGRIFAGLYGEQSFASSFPAEEDLYLEKLCSLSPEGKIVEVAQYSLGGIIRIENVATLEFFESASPEIQKPGETHEQ
jgi:hypothetical protein